MLEERARHDLKPCLEGRLDFAVDDSPLSPEVLNARLLRGPGRQQIRVSHLTVRESPENHETTVAPMLGMPSLEPESKRFGRRPSKIRQQVQRNAKPRTQAFMQSCALSMLNVTLRTQEKT